MSIAENIKRLRESHGLSQAEFGAIAGVSDKAVSTWEKGLKSPRMGAIQRISDHFGIPKSSIIDDIDPLPAKQPASDEDIKFALFGGAGEITEAMYEEVKNFAAYVRQREMEKKKKE